MAMTKDELLKRIEKKEKDIEKINKRITKWGKGLRQQDINIVEPFGEIDCVYGTPKYKEQYGIYSNYKEEEKHNIPESDDWNKGPNFYELYSAYRDLGDNKLTLKKYQDALSKIDNFENMEKIKPLWDFLTEWEEKCFDWYLKNAEKYFELKKNYDTAWLENKEKYMEWYPKYRNWESEDRNAKNHFNEDYYASINNLTVDLVNLKYETVYDDPNHKYEWDDHKRVLSSYTVDKEKLAKVLADEKVRKYEDLVNRITSVVGVIQDAKGLHIGDKNGEINGYVIGDQGKASVETISASGPVQCFHYRVLVHKLH